VTNLSSRADVGTDTPERYAKQLVSHLGRRVTFLVEGDTSTAEFGAGTGTVVCGDGVLVLLAQAPDEETLARDEHVLGNHLERFAQRSELRVAWRCGEV
jgi:hypothetical protein